MLRLRVVVFALFVAACGAKKEAKTADTEPTVELSEPSEPDPPKAAEVERAPFTAEQIRAATKTGRTYRYKVEVPNKAPRERVVTFTKVDDAGAEIFSGGKAPRRMGWITLQKQTEFPKDKVSIRDETIKIPAGTFDCVVYEVRREADEVLTYYFAKKLPGAPVFYYVEKDGMLLETTTLVEHIAGR